MNRKLLVSAVALATFSLSTTAQEAPAYENWVGGFSQYYSVDNDKPRPLGYLDDGYTLGAEMGFRFDPSWAARFELSRVFLDMTGPNRPGHGDDGTILGADIMYFLEDDSLYLFGGVREMSVQDSYRSAALGVGKHWELSKKWRFITELAAQKSFGNDYEDYTMKVGMAYLFGNVQDSNNGTAKDSDGDGVYDAVDRCPTSAIGAQVDATGCSVDLDGDGVLNNLDQCPRTPAGTKVQANGCAVKDADMDGVMDDSDACPNTPAGTPVNAKGCAADLDLDNDGVLDSMDKCLNTPSTDKVDSDGCSVLIEKEVTVALNVLFDNNSSIIRNPKDADIVEFAEFMQRYGNTDAIIEGHTSSVGTAEYNQYLSQKRAQSLKTLLVNSYGIAPERLKAVGFGETQLKDTADTAAAHRINRRIEVKVTATIKETATR